MDTTLVGGAADDTYRADQTTLTAGDRLDGGAGIDILQLTTNATGATTIGSGVTSTAVETVSITATGGALTVDTTGFAGVTTLTNTGSTTDISVTNLGAIPAMNVVGTSSSLTAGFRSAATTASATDSLTVTVNGAATTSNAAVTVNGIETINVVASGSATGSAASALTVASDTLTTLAISGEAAARLAANIVGATATVTGTVTSDGGAHDVTIGGVASTSKLNVSMGGGNDTVRISAIGATHTIAGGDGTDTLVTSASITTTTGANISGFEAVEISGGATVALSTASTANPAISTLTIRDAGGGSLTGLATGGTVNLTTGGNATVANTAWATPTTDTLTVNVGANTTAGALTASTVTATGIDQATINNLALANNLNARTVGVSGANLTKVTVNGAMPVTITGGGAALVEIDASGVSGAVTFSATTSSTAGLRLTGGAGADAITGGALADSIVGGAGNDTITGGAGIDTLTGGDGTDVFVFAANNALTVTSSLAAPDVINDFASGVDKLQIAQTITAFLGNFATVSQAQAAAAADGRGNLAYYVTGENALYVVAATNGVAVATDTVVTFRAGTVTGLTSADLQLGAQGTGNSITLSGVPVLSTTTSTNASAVATNLDDSISAAAATSLVGTGASINAGLGQDTVSGTIATADLVTNLTTAGTSGVALSGVENVTLTVTASTAAVNLGTNLPTDLRSLTIAGTDGKQGLTATTTAAGQTISVVPTATVADGAQASTITVAHNQARVTLGTANDTVIITTDRTGSAINTGAGADTITYGTGGASFAGVLPTTSTMTINGGGQDTGTVDTFAYAGALGNNEDINLQTYFTNGTLAGIERVTFASSVDNSPHTITLATGVTQLAFTTDNGAENFTINATAAQANALTSVVVTTGTGTDKLVITDAGTVSFAGDTFTLVDEVNFAASNATTITLGASTTPLVQTGTGTADTTVNLFTTTFTNAAAAAPTLVASPAQSVTATSTGNVTFNISRAALQVLTAATGAGGQPDAGDVTLVSPAAATTVLNVTNATTTTYDADGTGAGAGAVTAIDFTNVNLVTTNARLDQIRVGDVTTAQSFSFGAGTSTTVLADPTTAVSLAAGPVVNVASTGTTNVSFTVATDSGNVGTRTLVVSGFTAGAGTGADVFDLGGTIVAQPGIVTTGAAATQGAAGAFTDLLILSGASFQINGSLTQTGNAGEVEAKIIAAGITLAAQTATQGFYIVMDNGTDTGVYQVTLAASAGTAGVIDNAADFSVRLVGVISGIGDAGLFVGPNFG